MSGEPWGAGAIWRGRARAAPFAVLGLVSLVAGVVLVAVGVAAGEGAAAAVALTLVALGLALLFSSSVEVAIGSEALEVRSTNLPWPRPRILLDRIAAAEAVEVLPGQLGLALSRWRLPRMDPAAGFHRGRRAGLFVQRRRGLPFVVVLDDADVAAAVLNDLVARRRSG